MTATERRRLARILGMLGSEHAGERASAALQAEAFRKRHAMTWEEMLAIPPVEEAPEPEPVWTPPPPEPETEPPHDPYAHAPSWAKADTRPPDRPAWYREVYTGWATSPMPVEHVPPLHRPLWTYHPIAVFYAILAVLYVAWSWNTYG